MAIIHVSGNGINFSFPAETINNLTQTTVSGKSIGKYSQVEWTGFNLTYDNTWDTPAGGQLLSLTVKNSLGIEQYSVSTISYQIDAKNKASNSNNFFDSFWKTIFSDNNTWSGTIGDDLFPYTARNDMYYGGSGIDTLVMANSSLVVPSSDFTIGTASYGYTLTLTKPGLYASGAMAGLSSVERIKFSDKSFALDTDGNAGQAYRLYQAAFNRKPDSAGLGYWISHLDSGKETLKQVATGFINSAEFKQLYGANLSDTAYLTALYRNVLHRAPDQGGFDYWNSKMTTGASRADILVNFSESQENVAQVIGQISHGMEYIPYIG